MKTKVFLSLSHVDEKFVERIFKRLPHGLAYFYKESFSNGDLILDLMEKGVKDSNLFVLFASKKSLSSGAVAFELDNARLQSLYNKNNKILIFPTDNSIDVNDFPDWVKNHWIAGVGYMDTDVSRHINATLLDSEWELSINQNKVVGRGKALDKLEQLTADHIVKYSKSPKAYIFPGLTGIGRRTFAKYYAKHALPSLPNLLLGPTFTLPSQADIMDLYRAVRSELDSNLGLDAIIKDLELYQSFSYEKQIEELLLRLKHFFDLGQAVFIISASGFFEDMGATKSWVLGLFKLLPENAKLFIITGKTFDTEFLEQVKNSVQISIREIDDKDIETLMVFEANRIGLQDFNINKGIVKTIGGHPGLAKTAVNLVDQNGVHILERSPNILFDMQNLILKTSLENVIENPVEKSILSVLSWLPALNPETLEKIVLRYLTSCDEEKYINAIKSLISRCLINFQGTVYSISPPIRFMFRRSFPSDELLIDNMAIVLEGEWKISSKENGFRVDLFDAFLFMHALEGKSLPKSLRSLIAPGILLEVIKTSYARGKESDDQKLLIKVVEWGEVANDIQMSDTTLNEIMTVVVSAKIRLGKYSEVSENIDNLYKKGNNNAPFLEGYCLRRQGKYEKAAIVLESALSTRKKNRAVVHELAICYKNLSKNDKLEKLLEDYKDILEDSPTYIDLKIGIAISKGKIDEAEDGIELLAKMTPEGNHVTVRTAQLLLRKNKFKEAINFLNNQISNGDKSYRLRALRIEAALEDGDFDLARTDLYFIKEMKGRDKETCILEIKYLMSQQQFVEAEELIESIQEKSPPDWLLVADLTEKKSRLPNVMLAEKQDLEEKAALLRSKYSNSKISGL